MVVVLVWSRHVVDECVKELIMILNSSFQILQFSDVIDECVKELILILSSNFQIFRFLDVADGNVKS